MEIQISGKKDPKNISCVSQQQQLGRFFNCEEYDDDSVVGGKAWAVRNANVDEPAEADRFFVCISAA